MYDLQVKATGNDTLEVASILYNMALVNYMLELYTPSLHLYRKTLRITLAKLQEYNERCLQNPNHAHPPMAYALNKSVGDSLNAMGLLYVKIRRPEEAASAFACALGVRERLHGTYHPDVTTVWYNLGTVRVEMGDLQRAIPLYEEGLRRDRVALGGDPYHPRLSSTLQILGDVYQQAGQIEESLVCFHQSLVMEKGQAVLSQIKGTDQSYRGSIEDDGSKKQDHWGSVTRLLNVIGNIHLMQANIPAMMECFVEAAKTASMLLETRSQFIPLVVAGHIGCHLTRLHPNCASAA